MSPTANEALQVLRSTGVLLVLDTSGPGLPTILHWGADLPDDAIRDLPLMAAGPVPHSAVDEPWPLTVLPTPADGWLGTPAYAAHRAGGAAAPRWSATTSAVGDTGIRVSATADGVRLEVDLALDEFGVLTVTQRVVNEGQDILDLAAVRAFLPLPSRAAEVLVVAAPGDVGCPHLAVPEAESRCASTEQEGGVVTGPTAP